MADTLNPQELAELKQLYKDLQNISIPDMSKFIQALGGVEDARKNLTQMRKEFANLNSDVSYFAESLSKVLIELKNQNNALGKTKSAYSSLSSIASKLKYDQDGISRLGEKELKKMTEKLAQQRQSLSLASKINEERIKDINKQIYSSNTLDPKKLASLRRERKALQDANSETKQFLTDTQNGYIALEAAVNTRIKREKEIQKAIGLTGNILKGLSKIPGIGSALDTEQALEDMRDLADEIKDSGGNVNSFSNRLKIAGKGFSTAFGGLRKTLTDPVAILTFIVERALAFNKASVDIGKNLGTGTKESDRIAQNLANVANNSSNLNVTFKNAVEAMNQLNESTGLVANYSADALETQIMLTKQFGLTGEEAAGIYKFSALTGKASSEVNDEMVGAFVATRNSVKVGANFKQVMAEAAKVSGQLAANFRNNPAAITSAIVQMKALGTSLEQTKNQGSQLLDFESSLENELKAELLTGQQLNLERARAAALAGDQVELAKELSNQGMTLEKFSSMNVLAQNAYSQALGLTSDQLSDQLTKQKQAEKSGKSLADITKEQTLEAEKRQAVQDKFTAAMEKIMDIVGNLVAGPFAMLLEILAEALNIIGYIVKPIEWMKSLATAIGEKFGEWATALGPFGILLKAIAGIAILLAAYGAYAALSWIPVVGPLLGAAAAVAVTSAGFSALNAQKAGDMISPADGKTQVSTKEGGLFELSSNDDLLAGPGLASGGGGISGGSMSIDLTPMINAITEVRDAVNKLYSKEGIVNIDGKKVGTLLTQGSYKTA